MVLLLLIGARGSTGSLDGATRGQQLHRMTSSCIQCCYGPRDSPVQEAFGRDKPEALG
jgi:hypothetical protein